MLQAVADVVEKSSAFSHPGLCPIWILASPNGPSPAVVMPWFGNGNVLEFMQRNPKADKLQIVRLCSVSTSSCLTLSAQVKQLADVVNYIHANGEVHGNILPVRLLHQTC